MGFVERISTTSFPKQGGAFLKRVNVFFQYDTANKFPGMVVRDDLEEPFKMIIALNDGRVVLGTECQYEVVGEFEGRARPILTDVKTTFLRTVRDLFESKMPSEAKIHMIAQLAIGWLENQHLYTQEWFQTFPFKRK